MITEGEILYKNNRLKYDKKSLYNLRKEVGIVFQDPEKQIFYSMVYDDLAFALRNIGMDEKSIKDRINKDDIVVVVGGSPATAHTNFIKIERI